MCDARLGTEGVAREEADGFVGGADLLRAGVHGRVRVLAGPVVLAADDLVEDDLAPVGTTWPFELGDRAAHLGGDRRRGAARDGRPFGEVGLGAGAAAHGGRTVRRG